MELCVMIEGQEGVTWPQWQEIAVACEQYGVGSLFRSDHYLPLDGHEERLVLDAWGTICALAATTTTLRLGTLVSPATFRHPANLAKLAVTADQVSGGRVSLGLGAGWHAREHEAFGFPFGSTRERMDVFAEQLEIVRGLWSPREPLRFDGAHYRVGPVDPRPRPQAPWLIVGGSAGPRSAALAARFADEYNTVFATPDECRRRRAAVEGAWRDGGRSDLRFSVMTGAVLGRDRAEAAERARAIGERTGQPGFTPPEGWITGTPDEAAEQLRALAEVGVDRVMLQLLLHEDTAQIELIGRELAPAVAGG
jgi:alkanesulfonate monooxygenase SsuD/methylene tetrahydromethanopterin reductase-like flavin-dependent oxidoreductase (luciferase family)